MARFTFGPPIGAVELVYVPPVDTRDGVAVLMDVEVAFAGFTPAGEFSFAVPAYDRSTHDVLDAIHIVLILDGKPVPTDAAAAVVDASLPHYSTPTATILAGGPVVVDCTAADAGKYTALAILEFNS